MSHPHRFAIGVPVVAVAAALAGAVAGSAAADETIGRVVAVRGEVTAQAPGGEPRTLRCDDPIYAGDQLSTAADGRLGVLSGGIYSGIGEKSAMRIDSTEAGAPSLDLQRGHLRVVDAESGAQAPARLETPGLVAQNAGHDTEALVFPEKAWKVSMVCAYDDPVAVTRAAKGDGTSAEPGTCAVDKPREPLFTAQATHPRLPVIQDDCHLAAPVAGGALDYFGSPADVALGPDVAAAAGGQSLAPAIGGVGGINQLRTACDTGNCTSPNGPPRPPFGTAPFPFRPPGP